MPRCAEEENLPMDHAEIATRDFFFVGGEYAGTPGEERMHGQMHVEVLVPRRPRRAYPLVMFHGAGQTATNWLGTPDGRMGWAEYFVREGYTVYVVDQPARGRSAWQPGIDGEMMAFNAPLQEWLFTASASDPRWPQAVRHTQWPGTGRRGDPVFDAFQATQVPFLKDQVEIQRLVQAAGAALLDRIGPAVLMTHSQSGTFGWIIAEARPALVKAVVALEPAGPPFENTILFGGVGRVWGVADLPLTYDPPAGAAEDLDIEQQEEPDHPDLVRCRVQKSRPRRLVNLADKPVLILTGEASYHAVYDHCTARYLSDAGVPVTFIRLEDRGIRGNGHMLMLEKNSLDIAALVADWLATAAT
jgi:pimeloyl-ACP methyl ester carboxylesterase